MQLFWMEIRKIFSWKIVALIMFVNVLLYWALFEYNITFFPNGRPLGDLFKIEQQLIPKYGATIEEEESKDLVSMYEQEVKKANEFLAHDPKAREVNLTTYEEFSNVDPENETQWEYHNYLFFDSKEDFPWVLNAWYSLLDNYNHREKTLRANIEETSGARQQRYKQLYQEEKYPVYSSIVLDNFHSIKESLAIIILLSISILLSPIFLRDRLTSVLPLQCTSKKGRRIFWTKWLAGLVSAVLTTIALLIIYLAIYSTNDIYSHLKLPLYSLSSYFWYDITFFQYIILSIVAIFIAAVFLGILSMAISTFARNTIALIGIQIIVMFGMIAGITKYMISDIISIGYPKWLTPTGYIFLIGLTIILTFYAWRRESNKDIL